MRLGSDLSSLERYGIRDSSSGDVFGTLDHSWRCRFEQSLEIGTQQLPPGAPETPPTVTEVLRTQWVSLDSFWQCG